MDMKNRTAKTGYDLIRDPLLNKGTAFTPRERRLLHLDGLLPCQENTMEQQAQRVYNSLRAMQLPMDKYISLSALQDRNEHLFYKLLGDHIEEFMPIVYTPTVGLATQNFSHVFQRGRGVWITPDFTGRIAEVLANAVGDRQIALIVATDNESILGIGDQGAGGMAISIGKLALYVAGAGIHPGMTLPVSLDVGTDNPDLLNDELYLGYRQPRLRGEAYDALVDEFVDAVKSVCPGALLQWEDFRKDNALSILNRHRGNLASFNDDIQGTGAVALAGVLTGLRVTDVQLEDQRVLIYGAGAAGLGIARQIKSAMMGGGLAEPDARARIGVLDSHGILVDDREIRDSYKLEMAWPAQVAKDLGLGADDPRTLDAVVDKFLPTVLIGSSGHAGAFTESIVRRIAQGTDRPVILPFSNPTSRAEATPADILTWSDGRALVATGSPFDPVEFGGRSHIIGQGNNVFIFPGLGLGARESAASEITDSMVSAASAALAAEVTKEELAEGLLFPAISRLAGVSESVALAVARQAQTDGVARRPSKEVEESILNDRWSYNYDDYTDIL